MHLNWCILFFLLPSGAGGCDIQYGDGASTSSTHSGLPRVNEFRSVASVAVRLGLLSTIYYTMVVSSYSKYRA